MKKNHFKKILIILFIPFFFIQCGQQMAFIGVAVGGVGYMMSSMCADDEQYVGMLQAFCAKEDKKNEDDGDENDDGKDEEDGDNDDNDDDNQKKNQINNEQNKNQEKQPNN